MAGKAQHKSENDAATKPGFSDHGFEDAPAPLTYPFEDIPGMGGWQAIGKGLFWSRMPLPLALDHINIYFVQTDQGWAVIDTGPNTKAARAAWETLFEGALADTLLTDIVVTHYHPDHLGLAGWLEARTGAAFHMSHGEYYAGRTFRLDAREDVPEAVIRFYRRAGFAEQALQVMRRQGFANFAKVVSEPPPSFCRLREGGMIRLGGRAFHIIMGSGHSPEHACLYDETAGLLIAGDQLLPRITSNISVYPTEPYANPLQDWVQSLQKLRALPGDTLVLPAHNEPFQGLRVRIDQMLKSHRNRLTAVAKACAGRPRSAIEAFPALFGRKLDGFEFMLATGESLAHLHYLEERGVLERNEDGPAVRFVARKAFEPDF